MDLDALPDPVCEYCGETIEERDQACVALDEGKVCDVNYLDGVSVGCEWCRYVTLEIALEDVVEE